jgi:hypothetical protein
MVLLGHICPAGVCKHPVGQGAGDILRTCIRFCPHRRDPISAQCERSIAKYHPYVTPSAVCSATQVDWLRETILETENPAQLNVGWKVIMEKTQSSPPKSRTARLSTLSGAMTSTTSSATPTSPSDSDSPDRCPFGAEAAFPRPTATSWRDCP